MTNITYEGAGSISLVGPARIIDTTREMAWAEKHVRVDKDLRWILGNYVMADQANSNGHIFPLTDLQEYSQATIPGKPLNMLHIPDKIVGHYAAAEMLYPTGEDDADTVVTPHIEALSAFYHYYFPDAYIEVERAYKEGALFYSMECVPSSLVCAADGCGLEFAYAGRQSETYCPHLREPVADRQLRQPHFTGGALIIPPVRPGWKRADIKELSRLFEEAEETYLQVSAAAPHLDAPQWEALMLGIIEMARNVPMSERKKLAGEGKAMPDKSFPIATVGDLKNAIKLAGQAKDPAAARAHIKRRAKALGAENLIPESWK